MNSGLPAAKGLWGCELQLRYGNTHTPPLKTVKKTHGLTPQDRVFFSLGDWRRRV